MKENNKSRKNKYNNKNKNEMKNIDNNFSNIYSEDTTKYGEFISSYFAWTPLDKQKEISNKLSNLTKNK